MDENHQDKTRSKLRLTEDQLWLPPLSPKDQERLDHLRKKPFSERTGFSGKTVWDWFQLLSALAIPIVVLSATLVFSSQQDKANTAQHKNDLSIAEANRNNDLKIADDQQQEATLKTYLDDMTTLLLDKKLGSQAKADKAASDEAAVVARAKTLTALSRLTDPQRKARVLQFLYEAHLIGYLPCNTCSRVELVIDLNGADLRGAVLNDADLNGAVLSGTDLSGTHLSYALLNFAELHNADLSYADLSGANLISTDLSGADLSYALLSDADLSGANLIGASLIGANLSYALLIGANLSFADLRNTNVTSTQLAEAKSLQGTIMPDGSIHL